MGQPIWPALSQRLFDAAQTSCLHASVLNSVIFIQESKAFKEGFPLKCVESEDKTHLNIAQIILQRCYMVGLWVVIHLVPG